MFGGSHCNDYGDEKENDKQIYDKMDEIQRESSAVV